MNNNRVNQQKAAIERSYRDKADVYKKTNITGSFGQGKPTYPATPDISQMHCSLQKLWGQERKLQDKVAEESTYILYCGPQTVKFSAKDKLVIDGITYEIKVIDTETFKDIYWEVHLLVVA